jgi:tetratricopeptide (TPR) repeat protein
VSAPSAKNKSKPRRRQSLWNYVLTALVSAALGAGLTWFITAQRSNSNVLPLYSARPPAATLGAKAAVSGLSTGEAALELGNVAYDQQRWPEAIRQYQQAIATGTDTADVRTDLGNALRFSGQPEKALEQYQIAQKLNPQHENSLFNQIGLFTEMLHEPVRAIPVCEEFIRRFPASDKLTAVRQELARTKTTMESKPKSDLETRSALSQWLKEQQKTKP